MQYAVIGHVTSKDDINIVIGRRNIIEICVVKQSGIHPILELPLFSVILHLSIFTPKDRSKDLLYITTERVQYMILQYDEKYKTLREISIGIWRGPPTCLNDYSIITTVDTTSSVIVNYYTPGTIQCVL